MGKKDFTKAALNAADIFFSNSASAVQDSSAQNSQPAAITRSSNTSFDICEARITHDANDTNNTNITKHTYIANDSDITNITNYSPYARATNKSKHYDDRGKRGERYGILLDKKLKDDLRNLANATGSRSLNDMIVTILLDYVEAPEQQEILNAFDKLRRR